jgi:TonB family protein
MNPTLLLATLLLLALRIICGWLAVAIATPEIMGYRQSQSGEPRLRVAVVGFSREQASLEKTLAAELGKSEYLAIVEGSIMKSAVSGIGYDGSINMSKDEARRLGSAIGCDFFIIGKAEVVTRSEAANQSHQEALAAVMIVDGRAGALAVFDQVTAKAGSSVEAWNLISQFLAERAPGYVERIRQFHAARQVVRSSAENRSTLHAGRVEDLPAEGSSQAAGFKPPEFINRVKPEYTVEAERADISATVEAKVVLRANGEIGEIEILRWAGFGLDDAAVRAIHQLKFKPATRDGQPVGVRAIIRYNFRRVVPGVRRAASLSPRQSRTCQ